MSNKIVKIFLTLHLVIICQFGFSQTPVLVGYTLFPCDKNEIDNVDIIQKRVISKTFNHDTLTIMIATIMNCCDGDTGSFQLKGDTIFLKSNQKPKALLNENGDTIGWKELYECECECCFDIEFRIRGLLKKEYLISCGGEILKLLPNRYQPTSYFIYENDTIYNYHNELGYKYRYGFYESGKLKTLRISKYPHSIWKTYYENGQLKSEREFYRDIDNAIIKEYDENGKLIRFENNLKK